jgi:hypothetical protein
VNINGDDGMATRSQRIEAVIASVTAQRFVHFNRGEEKSSCETMIVIEDKPSQ